MGSLIDKFRIKKKTQTTPIDHDENLLKSSDLFDAKWYSATYKDKIYDDKTSAEYHYLYFGFKAGLDPSERFSTTLYLEKYEDVKKSGINPLIHYIKHGVSEGRVFYPRLKSHFDIAKSILNLSDSQEKELRIIEEYGMFQSDWYSDVYFDKELNSLFCLAHYIKFGADEGFDPTPSFNTREYIANNKDLIGKQVNPYAHYLINGRKEGREAYASEYLVNSSIVDLANSIILDKSINKIKRNLIKSEFFDSDFFSKNYLIKGSEEELLNVFMLFGDLFNFDPHPLHSTKKTKERHADLLITKRHSIELLLENVLDGNYISEVADQREKEKYFDRLKLSDFDKKQVDCIYKSKWFNGNWYASKYDVNLTEPRSLVTHFVVIGSSGNFDPCPQFSTSYYLNRHPDVKTINVNPTYHYITHGRKEGREISVSRYSKRNPGNELLLEIGSVNLNYSYPDFIFEKQKENDPLIEPACEVLNRKDFNLKLQNSYDFDVPYVSCLIKDIYYVNERTIRIVINDEFPESPSQVSVNLAQVKCDGEVCNSIKTLRVDESLYLDYEVESKYNEFILILKSEKREDIVPFKFPTLLRGNVNYHELNYETDISSYLETLYSYSDQLRIELDNINTSGGLKTRINFISNNLNGNEVILNKRYRKFLSKFGVDIRVLPEKNANTYDLSLINDFGLNEENCYNLELNASSIFLEAQLTISGMIALSSGRKIDVNSFIYCNNRNSSNISFFSFQKNYDFSNNVVTPLFIYNNPNLKSSVSKSIAPDLSIYKVEESDTVFTILFFLTGNHDTYRLLSILNRYINQVEIHLVITPNVENIDFELLRNFRKSFTIHFWDDSINNSPLEDIMSRCENRNILLLTDEINFMQFELLLELERIANLSESIVVPKLLSINKKGRAFTTSFIANVKLQDRKNNDYHPFLISCDDDYVFVDGLESKVLYLNRNSKINNIEFNLEGNFFEGYSTENSIVYSSRVVATTDIDKGNNALLFNSVLMGAV